MTIPQYSIVSLLEKGSSWCKVSYGGKTGYVMTGYLAFTGNPPVSGSNTQTAWVLTDSGSLNIRSRPESAAMKVGTAPRLAQVTVYSKGSTWSQISFNGVSGYVMTKYLTFTKPSELASTQSLAQESNQAQETSQTQEETETQQTNQTQQQSLASGPVLDPTLRAVEDMIAVVTPDNGTLNLRAECSTTAAVLLEMPEGETVDVLMRGETWCKVVFGDQEGYCMTKYLTFPSET